jgi:hypothetical protein
MMTKRQIRDILELIVSVDGRRITENTPSAWLDIIGDLNHDDARSAIIAHYRESTEWLTPGHIRARVAAMRQKRIRAIGATVNASRADTATPEREIQVQRALTRALGDGTLTPDQYAAYHASGVPWDDWTSRAIAA